MATVHETKNYFTVRDIMKYRALADTIISGHDLIWLARHGYYMYRLRYYRQ